MHFLKSKSGEIPYWVTMLIFSLLTLVVVVILISIAKGKAYTLVDQIFG